MTNHGDAASKKPELDESDESSPFTKLYHDVKMSGQFSSLSFSFPTIPSHVPGGYDLPGRPVRKDLHEAAVYHSWYYREQGGWAGSEWENMMWKQMKFGDLHVVVAVIDWPKPQQAAKQTTMQAHLFCSNRSCHVWSCQVATWRAGFSMKRATNLALKEGIQKWKNDTQEVEEWKKNGLRYRDDFAFAAQLKFKSEHFFGFADKTRSLRLKNEHLQIWNLKISAPAPRSLAGWLLRLVVYYSEHIPY